MILDAGAQLQGVCFEFFARIERGGRCRVAEQREGLVVEQRAVVERGAGGVGESAEQSVAAPIVMREVVKSAAHDTGRVATPAELRRLREGINLARMKPRAPGMKQGGAPLIKGLLEAAVARIDAVVRPERVGVIDRDVRDRGRRQAGVAREFSSRDGSVDAHCMQRDALVVVPGVCQIGAGQWRAAAARRCHQIASAASASAPNGPASAPRPGGMT